MLPCAVASMEAASMRCRPSLLGLAEKCHALPEVARAASIYKAQKFSDHAPLSIDYDFKL